MTAFALGGCLVEEGLGLGHWELKAQREAQATVQSIRDFVWARLGWTKANAPPIPQREHVIRVWSCLERELTGYVGKEGLGRHMTS